jgi:hypothetical protein
MSWLEEELARWTYKPGWRLNVHEPVGQAPWIPAALIATFQAPDSRGSGRIITITSQHSLPHYLAGDEAAFPYLLRDALMDAEGHEIDEWLRRDGRIFHDPHERSG